MSPISASEPVFCVPGQGADPRGALRAVYGFDRASAAVADEILEEIERALRAEAPSQWDPAGPSIREVVLAPSRSVRMGPGVPQLAGYAISVILARLLGATGVTPTAIVGQSFGEIAALVCAGAFDVADGTRAVCALNTAFRDVEGRGAMVLLAGVGEAECRRLLTEVAIPDLVLACVNAPDQTIVSGPTEAVDALLTLSVPRITRLSVPYASHHPSLNGVAERFLRGMSHLRQRPLRVPVHSPVGRRAYTDRDDLRRALADCVVEPVYLPETLRRLGSSRLFFELGPGDLLTRCVRRTLPGAQAIAPLTGDLAWLHTALR